MNSPSTSSHPRSKSSRENAENDCSEKKQNVKHEKVPLKEVNRDDSVSTTRPATKKTDRKKLVEDYNDNVPFEGNNYPEETTSPIDRRFLQLSEVPGKKHGNGEQSTGEFLPEADSMCVICHQEECPKGKTELIDCHGQMSGEMFGVERITTLNKNYEEEYKKEYEELLKKDPNAPYKPKKLLIPERPCRSKFHESCIMKYNAAGYFFQYAARLECQAKFLCPLHCCNRCNVGHQRQTAYAGELIECAKCLRAFHIQTCYPAGARDQYVEFQMGDKKKKNFEFLICPAHADEDSTESASSEKKKVAAKKDSGKRPNLKACCSEGCTLGVEFKLINCRSCVRSFHVECREVIKIDGVLVSNDLCEKCLCKDDVPLNVPVLALWENKDFYLAKTVGWYNFPSNRRSSEPNFEKLGYTVVQWLSEDSAGKTFSIVPVHNVAPLIDEYVRLAKPNLRSFWKKTFDDYNDKGCLFGPYVSKLVYQPWKTSRLGRNITAQPPTKEDFGDCRCENNAQKCLDESCDSVNEGVECPPDCGDLCNNRNVSKGYVNPKLLLRDTKTKGYGIFAKEEIAQGEFLAEYVGELINPTEKARRLQIIAISRDFQANQYMMDLGKGWAVDAARYGNLARYINHSCDPNSASYSTAIVKGGNAENRKYERRVCVRATRPIAKGEEITFCYQMESTVEIPCLCGATNCTGYMGRGEEDEDEEDEKTKRMGRAKKNTKNSKPSKKRLRAPSVRKATTSKKRQFSEPSSRAVPRPSSSQQASTSAPRPVRSSNAQRSVESRESRRDETVATISSSRRMSTRERVSKKKFQCE
ncbi:hypothetical protein L5515_007307 [Caenorhabditis briggsae]|uniref:Protein CBR-MES-4 n=1 Tax=Caenorhabditis briggsae TaxID=6238 RepID=A0AAE9F3W6_CAEBR|nr:hypothetical protein L5515_007307 [Caenorhabditis briggsae]